MASDRPDSSDDARPRFTTRTYLLPDDEPGDGAGDAAFGTGDIDDDALDAIVQDVDTSDAAAFVWPSDVGEPLPVAGAEPGPTGEDAPVRADEAGEPDREAEAVAAMWDPDPTPPRRPIRLRRRWRRSTRR